MSDLSVQGISKRFCHPFAKPSLPWVLKDLTFGLDLGNVLWLKGANGSGKTTLLKILATLSAPSSGSLTLQNIDLVKDARKARALISYVSSEAGGFFDTLTNRANIEIFLALNASSSSLQDADVSDLIRRFGLDPMLDLAFSKNSLGTKRKFLIVLSLLKNPRLLLLDEGVFSLDENSRQIFREIVEERLLAKSMMMIWAGHDQVFQKFSPHTVEINLR